MAFGVMHQQQKWIAADITVAKKGLLLNTKMLVNSDINPN